MRSTYFWFDAAERAVKTFAQALLGVFLAGTTILNAHWADALTVAATAALVSVLTSIASAGVGEPETASLVSSGGKHRVLSQPPKSAEADAPAGVNMPEYVRRQR